MATASTYYIEGREAKGDAFRLAVAELDPADLDSVTIQRPDGSLVTVFTGDESGTLNLMLTHPDGSEWCCDKAMSVEAVQERLARFLKSEDAWDQDLIWDQVSLPRREARRRLILLLIVGFGLFAVAWWLLQTLQTRP